MGVFKLLGDARRLALIVSLPDNTVELALAAIEGGADGVKVHLNVEHRASGTRFGSFAQERPRLEAIVEAIGNKAALGIMPGAEAVASLEELDQLKGMGFEFVDCYAHHFPAHYLGHGGMKKVLALGPTYVLDEVKGLASLGVDALEASIVEPEGYCQPLSASDLARYRALVGFSRLPVLVPTQRRISPADIPLLAWAGVTGILIGAVVTGKEPDGVRKTTAAFRDSISRFT
ncbi:MAG: hypothetical protein HY815_26495 [Candidatus Riflebacteria bacterium]|nr:hypothetical protein [Candidatus Riflebacteria bacterium]